MTTLITRHLRMCLVAALFLSITLCAQSRLPVTYNPAPPAARDLNSTLGELMRVAPTTSQDLTGLQHQQGRLHWVKFWRRDGAHRSRIVAALRRNLQNAVPNLIHEAQASSGNISTTFRLYKDLSVVCESLESLLPPGSGESQLQALTGDLSDMNRIREDLSAYIQQTAAAIESKNPQLLSSAGRFPKKIIIDDNVPDKPARKRHSPSQ